MAIEIVKSFRLFVIEMSFDTPAFKVLAFASDLESCDWGELLLVDIQTEILLTMMGSIDHFSKCKLGVYVIAHTKEKPYTANWYLCKICKATKVRRVSKIW